MAITGLLVIDIEIDELELVSLTHAIDGIGELKIVCIHEESHILGRHIEIERRHRVYIDSQRVRLHIEIT